MTYRPNRHRRAERFFESTTAIRLRTSYAVRAARRLPVRARAALQVHALFAVHGSTSVIHVDCTHAQSSRFWPPWNPLRGRALSNYIALERKAYDGTEHLFAFNEATRSSLIDDDGWNPGKVTAVGLGVNFCSLPSVGHASTDAAPREPIILFVGHDFERKGGSDLLDAL